MWTSELSLLGEVCLQRKSSLSSLIGAKKIPFFLQAWPIWQTIRRRQNMIKLQRPSARKILIIMSNQEQFSILFDDPWKTSICQLTRFASVSCFFFYLKMGLWIFFLYSSTSLSLLFWYRHCANVLCFLQWSHLIESVEMVNATLQRTEIDGQVLLSSVVDGCKEAQVKSFESLRTIFGHQRCFRASLMIFTCSVLEGGW